MMVKDRTIVLSGAAGGIGEALTKSLLDEGATVVAVDIDEARLRALHDRLGRDRRLAIFTADVSREAPTRELADAIRRQHGTVDILINNAGYFPSKPFREISYAEWQEVTRINLDSVFLMTQALLPLIEGRGWGRIINIGSASVFRGVPTQVHYVAAKAGVVGFTRSMALVLGPLGITVNVVAPGLTSTPAAIAHIAKAFIDDRVRARAIAREQQPADLTGAVLFLASTQSDFMTGQTLNVDGGTYMN
jgi:NAD(P)-dependent dehydrogenase (short-subunit alcohol dehydrogenase family)